MSGYNIKFVEVVDEGSSVVIRWKEGNSDIRTFQMSARIPKQVYDSILLHEARKAIDVSNRQTT